MKTKRVFITGASSGIGKGIAEHLAGDHLVTISDCSKADVLAAQADLAARGIMVEAQVFDVCNPKHLEELKAQANSKRVDVLINNAGMQHVEPIENFPPEKWQQLIDIMLVGPAMTTRAVLPSMRKHNYGRIINVGSVHSLVASAYKSAYVAAKHGLIGLAKTVALEVKDADITINTLCPGYVDTDMVRNQIKQQAEAHQIPEAEVVSEIMLKNMPKKQFIAIEELAGTVAFLIGPYAKSCLLYTSPSPRD